MIKIKKIIYIAFVLLILTGCQDGKEEKETSQETNQAGNLQSYTVDNITFDNIDINYEENQTSISMTINNNQEKTINLGTFKVNALNEDDEVIKTFDAYYDLDIASQDEGELTVSVDQKLENIKSITIDLAKTEN